MVSTRQMTTTTPGGGSPVAEETVDSYVAAVSTLPNTNTTHCTFTISRPGAAITSRQSSTIDDGGPLQSKKPKNLMDLPVEILDKIFGYTGYKNVAQIRLVSLLVFLFFIIF